MTGKPWSNSPFVKRIAAGVAFALLESNRLAPLRNKDEAKLAPPGTLPATEMMLIYLLVPFFCGWLLNPLAVSQGREPTSWM